MFARRILLTSVVCFAGALSAAAADRLRAPFNGSLVAASSGPLEFDLDQNGLEVSGAIALSVVHQ